MRPLTEDESKAVFSKLANYIGKNLVHLVDRQDEDYCFRLHRDRVYYLSESAMRMAISVARPNLVSLGTCFGKFSKSGKFKLHITALDYLAQYAKYKASHLVHNRINCTRHFTPSISQAFRHPQD
ncbi:ribosome biosynthesis protein nip7 [Ceratobasidium sp. 392]|nr:ribosome biosynthesis protein nip7 [Ceratobasidium sp. 392]